MKDIGGLDEKHPLNSRLVKTNGKLVEEVYRFRWKHDAEIRSIVQHLEAAIPFATEPMAKALRALVKSTRPAKRSIGRPTTSPGSKTRRPRSTP